MTEPRKASSEDERKAYFQPFTDEKGVERCGGQRRECKACSRKYGVDESLFLQCPECLGDRRCHLRQLANGRCKHHGGLNQAGELAPNFKHGRSVAKNAGLNGFPKHVQDAYVKALESADMTSVAREHALVQARMLLVAQSLPGMESQDWWKDLGAFRLVILDNRAAAAAGDKKAAAAVAKAFDSMLEVIGKGVTASSQWKEIILLNDKSAELKSRQASIERDQAAVLSASEAMNVFGAISLAMREALLLVKGRIALIRDSLFESGATSVIIDEAVDALESDGDPRQVVTRVVTQVAELVPVEDAERSVGRANDIVQRRIKGCLER